MWSSRRPASERAVTIVSSSCGWRSTIAAASAPANPAAPSTATLCTEGTAELGELGLDRDARAGHVLVGERAFGRAELDAHCQRLAALAHLLAAVDVEELRAVEQGAAARANGIDDGGREHVGVYDHGEVLDDCRECRHVAVRGRRGRQLGDQVG